MKTIITSRAVKATQVGLSKSTMRIVTSAYWSLDWRLSMLLTPQERKQADIGNFDPKAIQEAILDQRRSVAGHYEVKIDTFQFFPWDGTAEEEDQMNPKVLMTREFPASWDLLGGTLDGSERFREFILTPRCSIVLAETRRGAIQSRVFLRRADRSTELMAVLSGPCGTVGRAVERLETEEGKTTGRETIQGWVKPLAFELAECLMVRRDG